MRLPNTILIFRAGLILLQAFFAATFCPEIAPIQHADLIASDDPPYKTGTVLTIKCDKGFKGQGSLRITCLRDGSWSNPPPICFVFQCVRDETKTTADRICRKPCKSDKDCKGQFKKCECDDWCGKSCFNPEADCSALSPPKNGYINGSKFSYGYRVRYGCKTGFALTGPATRICRSDRTWSGYEPKCLVLSSCGQSGDTEKRIFSGKVAEGRDAKEGAWPWQTRIFKNVGYSVVPFYDKYDTFAGGSVINNKWILSAAHVFDNLIRRTRTRPINWTNKFLISIGMTSYPKEGERIPNYVIVFEPAQVHRHDLYDERIFDYDAALIRVGKRLKRVGMKFTVDFQATDGIIEFSNHIRPICLPCIKINSLDGKVDIGKNFDKKMCNLQGPISSLISPGNQVIVTGFGWARRPGRSQRFKPDTLQEGLLKILHDNVFV